ncbi:type I restriction-modification system subunit M [Parasegetibacter sp. NRK P23]|nr:type I restriction-modification system subunit M [Parasegetibacter sp. NRK P23]
MSKTKDKVKAVKKSNGKQSKAIGSTQSLSSYVKSICDIMRRSNCASALQYVPELTWILFLRILDAQEQKEREEAEVLGNIYMPALVSPFRWQDWAAPYSDKPGHPKTADGKPQGWKRQELFAKGDKKLFDFINNELLPHLHGLDIDKATGQPNPNATRKQRIIGRIMTAVERVRVDSETNLRDILDKVHQLHTDNVDDTHFFTLSQVYEDLLLKMGEKNSDGGQFFTPREVIRAMVLTMNPETGKTIFDPCCGTGGFLAVVYEYLNQKLGKDIASTDIDVLKHNTFFGKEKENLVFPIALANLVLHGIDQPNIWHGNTLTNRPTYGALFENAPSTFDYIFTNPPFGGKEGKDAQDRYSYSTSSTQVLFVQDIIAHLSHEGTCAIVLDEGLLFRTNESAFVETKRKLVDECNVWAIISMPGGVFSTAGAGVKTNLLFFTKGKQTDKIWYYDLSHVKVGKKTPMTLAHFGFDKSGNVIEDSKLPATLTSDWLEDEEVKDEAFPTYAKMLASKSESRYSWTIDFAARRAEALEKMQPYKDNAAKLREEIIPLKEQLKVFKKEKKDKEEIKALELQITSIEKVIKEQEAIISDIDAKVFDLKAVNPNAVVKTDTRTTIEVIENIEAQAKIIEDAMSNLKKMLDKSEKEAIKQQTKNGVLNMPSRTQ